MGVLILLIGIPLLVWVGYVVYNIYEYRYFDIDDILSGFGLAVVNFIATALILIIISIFPDARLQKVDTTEIAALKDKSKSEGVFFLGSGYIDEEQHYFYVEKRKMGMKMSKVSVDSTYVKENFEKPFIERYEHQYTSKFAQWMFGKEAWGGDKYVIHVPKDTVTTEFKIDME